MTDVFISYSRKDIAFARMLHQALKENNLETWIDWQDIPPSADWLSEVYEAIEGADAFVFVISETSLNSEICGLEINHAARHNKRLIPIVIKDVESEKVPKELAVLNWIFFDDAGEKFAEAMEDLVTAITVDQNWVKAHTRLENRALDWSRKDREKGVLLRGNDLTDAETWLAGAAGKDPQPTALQTQFILKSREDETRRQRITLGAVGAGLILSIVLSIFAWTQRNVAVSEGFARATAQAEAEEEASMRATQQAIAEEQRDLAVSQSLSFQSLSIADEFQDIALLLSLEGLHAADTIEARSSLLAGITKTPYLYKILFNDKNYAQCIEFSPNGKLVATCHQAYSNQGSVFLWDVESGKQVGILGNLDEGANSVKFNSDGRILAIKNYPDGDISFWDIENRELMYDQFPSNSWRVIAFHPSENLFALGNNDGIINLFDMETLEVITEIAAAGPFTIQALTFSPDGEQLAAGLYGGPITIWDLTTSEYNRSEIEGTLNAYILNYHPDGMRFAYAAQSGDFGQHSSWYMLEINSGQRGTENPCEFCEINSLEFNEDGSLLFVGDDRHDIRVFDVLSGTYTRGSGTLKGHTGEITSVSVSRVGNLIASTSDSKTWHFRKEASAFIWNFDSIYDFHSNSEKEGHDSIQIIGFPPNNDQLLISLDENALIEIWDTETGNKEGEIQSNLENEIQQFAFQPNSQILALGDIESNITLWDIEKETSVSSPINTGQDCIKSMVFTPQGELLTGGCDGTIKMWSGDDLHALPVLLEHPGYDRVQQVDQLASSPDGRWLASVGGYNLAVWDLEQEDPSLHILIPIDNDYRPDDFYGYWNWVAFHPNENIVAAGRVGGAIDIWEVQTWEWLRQVRDADHGGTDGVDSIAFSADGRWMASGHAGWTNLWDVETFKRVGESLAQPTTGTVYGKTYVAFSPDSSILASTGVGGINFWSLDINDWINSSCEIANRNLTSEEWKSYLGELPYHETCP